MKTCEQLIVEYEGTRHRLTLIKKTRAELIGKCLNSVEVKYPDEPKDICLVEAYKEMKQISIDNEEYCSFDEVLDNGDYCEYCIKSRWLKLNFQNKLAQLLGQSKRALSARGKLLIKEALK